MLVFKVFLILFLIPGGARLELGPGQGEMGGPREHGRRLLHLASGPERKTHCDSRNPLRQSQEGERQKQEGSQSIRRLPTKHRTTGIVAL